MLSYCTFAPYQALVICQRMLGLQMETQLNIRQAIKSRKAKLGMGLVYGQVHIMVSIGISCAGRLMQWNGLLLLESVGIKRSRMTRMEESYNDEAAAMTKPGDNTGHYRQAVISYAVFSLYQLLKEMTLLLLNSPLTG